jgi:hypothetical protein
VAANAASASLRGAVSISITASFEFADRTFSLPRAVCNAPARGWTRQPVCGV